jgi:hypothetical protein
MLTRAVLALAFLAAGCSKPSHSDAASAIKVVDVDHTAIERQSIGNCWIYAQAGWVESMHKSATGEHFDVSESYLSYWHWFSQIRGWTSEIDTSGGFGTANRLIRKYGLMEEGDFVAADTAAEISYRQLDALGTMNYSLAFGALSTPTARLNRALVRQELNRAFGLSPEVVAQLDAVFGSSGERSFASGDARNEGSAILMASQLRVEYATRNEEDGSIRASSASLAQAMREWRSVGVWQVDRAQELRMQRALHARQPVMISWAVDFNALENDPLSERRGSFNAATLAAAGPGRQGLHMTALEDYEVLTEDFGLLEAGVTLDPESPSDAAKLAAALLPSSRLVKLRTKNSWGAERPDRVFVAGMPGYHDLYMDYLNGPVTWCDEAEAYGTPAERGCNRTRMPLNEIILPPGF